MKPNIITLLFTLQCRMTTKTYSYYFTVYFLTKMIFTKVLNTLIWCFIAKIIFKGNNKRSQLIKMSYSIKLPCSGTKIKCLRFKISFKFIKYQSPFLKRIKMVHFPVFYYLSICFGLGLWRSTVALSCLLNVFYFILFYAVLKDHSTVF